jgi:hypothetical protein
VVSVLFIRTRVERAEREGMLRELGAGWRQIRGSDWLFVGVLAATVYHIANGVILVLTQVVAIDNLGGARSLGLIAAAEGAGGVVGAALAMRLRPKRFLRAGWTALLLMPIWAISYVWPGALTAVLAGAVLGYAGLSYFSMAWETAMQDRVPHEVLARVASWDMLTSFIAMPIGALLAGPLASVARTAPVLAACALVLLGASLAPLFVRGTRTLIRAVAESTPAVEPVAA